MGQNVIHTLYIEVITSRDGLCTAHFIWVTLVLCKKCQRLPYTESAWTDCFWLQVAKFRL